MCGLDAKDVSESVVGSGAPSKESFFRAKEPWNPQYHRPGIVLVLSILTALSEASQSIRSVDDRGSFPSKHGPRFPAHHGV